MSAASIAIVVNGERHEVPSGLSVADLLVRLRMNPARVAIERNRNVLPRAQWAAAPVENGDSFEIVHFVGGG